MKQEYKVVNVDHSLEYQGYNKDFGPLNIGQVHRYCKEVQEGMSRAKVVHHCSTHYQKQANACFLICAY